MATNLPKHESEHTIWYTCKGCEKRFLGWNSNPRKYCEPKCYHSSKEGGKIRGLPTKESDATCWIECQGCQTRFLAWKRQLNVKRYCTRSCASKHCNDTHDVRVLLQKKHGDAWLAHFTSWKQSISAKTKDELNPAYGKVYSDGGKSVKGYYKGKFFRSLLEYSYMKHLESRGLSLEVDVRYECFRVPFVFEGRNRTYHIDFHVVPEGIVYEVKPAYVVKNPPAIQLAKWEAAKAFCAERGLQFKVVTEKEFPKIGFKNAYDGDSEVQWDERTFKYFKAARDHLGRDREDGKVEYC